MNLEKKYLSEVEKITKKVEPLVKELSIREIIEKKEVIV